MRRISTVAVAAVCAATLAGCGEKSSYDAVMDDLRGWLRAVEAGDVGACDLETPGLHAHLLTEHPGLGGVGTSCPDRMARMDSLDLPDPDAAMSVPVWDPSGEALVDVVQGQGERGFAMQYDGDRWLVAGVD